MTDRAAEGFDVEGDLAQGAETGPDLHGEDRVRTELGHLLDRLDDNDREQRHFERYGCDDGDQNLIDRSGLHAPLVFELGNMRSLLANWAFVQSIMSIDDPDRLILDYTRQMMGFLLFHPSPRAIEMIGLGGGSLAKYCSKYLPEASITAVEIDPNVIAIGDQFFMPPEDDRFGIVCEDGAAFVKRDAGTCDVLLVDAFDKNGQPAALCSSEFYRDCHSRLNSGGVFVVNLCDHQWKHASVLSRIRECYGFTIDLRVKIGMNRVIFAFKDGRAAVHHGTIRRIARDLDQVHPMSFSPLANEILRRLKFLDRPAAKAGYIYDALQSLPMARLWSAN